MTSQQPQRPRRNASPSSKPPPMKATLVPISLRQQGSPTRSNGRRSSPTSSPTPLWASDSHRVKHRRSPDHRTSPERRSPTSPSFNKVERPKPVRASPSSSMRRTSSLDTITGYLTGIWPRDGSNYGPEMKHKSTQTEWDELNDDKKAKSLHKRSASWGSADQRIIKEKLKNNIRKQGSTRNTANNNRQSPVHGNHAAVQQQQQQSASTGSQAMPIPSPSIPKVPRARGSVEGLNQEIEKLVLTAVSGNIEDFDRTQEPAPDGHRAPLPGMNRTSSTRSVDTQTPAGTDGLEDDNNSDSSKSGSRCQSISPQFPISLDGSQPGSRSSSSGNDKSEKQGDASPELQHMPKYASSPNHNKSYRLTREPPDGCEKVKIVDESNPCIGAADSVFCPDKRVTFILRPSLGSAFCPILPNYPDLAVKSPAQQTTNSTGIEGQ
ncbi:protein FAM117B-like [Saccoglossus kowalevskii]|uniref:Protein FAM117B-like isoform X1 n=1 Tax=Saccoglossus kowalevskii TaxID=10224 RepID=A0ABM0GVU8_SACKO|nr:PREDICTED: protein FAM117B-like isoform X1 [Saccoglossus kowalevskii]